jgi:cation diffusion facilitator CzcD-associated flavoprotein CzcO
MSAETVDVLIVGSGFSGLGMAIRLWQVGMRSFLVIEKGRDIGGTWYENRYPGCACDIPSHLYSFSFDLNPDWSRMYAGQPEIQEYLRSCARRHGVLPTYPFQYKVGGGGVERAGQTLGGEAQRREQDVCASARVGHGSAPCAAPAGVEGHRAILRAGVPFSSVEGRYRPEREDGRRDRNWRERNPDRSGNCPAGAETAPVPADSCVDPPEDGLPDHRHVEGPVPALPRNDVVVSKVPVLAARDPGAGFSREFTMRHIGERMARRHLEQQIHDPNLRAALTPDYELGCKRVLVSSDFYPALLRDNVELVTSRISEVTEDGILTEDGRHRPLDVIIYGTGFHVTEPFIGTRVVGRGGIEIHDAWRQSTSALLGITVSGFPNFFLLLGPNTGLGHNSVVLMIEAQIHYIMKCLQLMRRRGWAVMEAREESQRRFAGEMKRRLARTVWQTGGCRSWYQDPKSGENPTIWPGSVVGYILRTRSVSARDFRFE